MRQTQDYTYRPFGSAITDMQYVNDTNRSYRYGFNGEEKENNIDGEGVSYDLGERFYDSRLGRMFRGDPLELSYPWQSTYVYCSNSPIRVIDYKGLGDNDPVPGYAKPASAKATSVAVFSIADAKEGGTFNSAFKAAMLNENMDVIITDDIISLNKILNDGGKIYDNIYFVDHGTYDISGQKIGDYIYNSKDIENNYQIFFMDIGNNIKKDGNIVFLGCFTGAIQYGGDEYLQKVANITGRKVYGNQGESWIGSNTFNNSAIGGVWDEHNDIYQEVATKNAFKWRKAIPNEKQTIEIGNLMISPEGVLSLRPASSETVKPGSVVVKQPVNSKPKPNKITKPSYDSKPNNTSKPTYSPVYMLFNSMFNFWF